MYCMLTEQIDEAYQTGKDILENVDIQAWLSDSFKKITADILKYIHDEDETKKYIDVVQKNQNDKQKNDEDDMLVYTPRSDTGSKKVNRGNVVTNVRVNNIISLDERKNILEAHNPIFRRKARQTETKEATDLYYLYRINNKVYMVIIEPTSGESYTKMIGVYDRWFLDKKEFDGFVEGYLQMTEKEMLASDEIVRTSHTTLETFKEIIDYALTGESHIYGGFHAKRKIKRLRTYPDKRG